MDYKYKVLPICIRDILNKNQQFADNELASTNEATEVCCGSDRDRLFAYS